MATVTIAPNDEAGNAIVDRINAGAAYILPRPAEYETEIFDALEDVDTLQVDLVHETDTDLNETLGVENRTSHIFRIWIRDKLPDMETATVAPRNLLLRQIWQQVNNYETPDGRVKVWDIGQFRGEIPGKLVLVQANFYRAYIEIRVEVEAP